MCFNNASSSPAVGGKKPTAEKMLGRRVARANHLWQRYWSTPHPAFN
jgi:hypothetical protein